MSYDAESLRGYFDDFGDREWQRLEKTLQGRVKYVVHRRLIDAVISPGMRVLDVGSGPGRFAIDMVHAGARVTLVDLSQVQLELARARLAEHGALDGVDGFLRLDVLDLSSLADGSYDAVVCIGGAISYTTTSYATALRELARVARPGAPLVFSVMSLLGAMRLIGPLDAATVLEHLGQHLDVAAIMAAQGVVFTTPGSKEFHQPLALFTAAGLRASLEAAGLEVETMATSNPLLPEYLHVPRIEASPEASSLMMALEEALCAEPGLLDAGGHLLAVARKR